MSVNAHIYGIHIPLQQMLIHIFFCLWTVFGWYNTSLIAPERDESYTLLVGYIKGAEELQENFEFEIVPQLGSQGMEEKKNKTNSICSIALNMNNLLLIITAYIL